MWKSFIFIQNELNFDEIVGFQDLHFLKTIEIAPNGEFIHNIYLNMK